jgi:subtilisin family serine protease
MRWYTKAGSKAGIWPPAFMRAGSRALTVLTWPLVLGISACDHGTTDPPPPPPSDEARITGVVTVGGADPLAAARLGTRPGARSARHDKGARIEAGALRGAPPRARLAGQPKSPRGNSGRALGVAPLASRSPGLERSRPQYLPDELIVTYRPGALALPAVGSAAMSQRAAATAVGAAVRAQLARRVAPDEAEVKGVLPPVLAVRLRVPDPARLDAVAAELRRDPAVAGVERHAIGYGETGRAWRAAPGVPDDEFYAKQAWHYAMIDLPRAWRLTTGSAGVLVAVVDDGIRFDHPDLAPNLTADGFDFVSQTAAHTTCDGGIASFTGDGDGDDPDPTIPASYTPDLAHDCLSPNPRGGHGLHVAGTIGAVGNDGFSAAGVNWAVRIRPVRVLDVASRGTDFDIAQGILYAAGLPVETESGEVVQATPAARIINVSIGSVNPMPLQESAVIAATDAGALVVASAGNNATGEPGYPAAYPQVLSVSAVGPDGELASYSNFGPTIDIAAPGGDIPDRRDDEDFNFGVFSTAWNFERNVPAGVFMDGTSMAAPHVSGVAALLLAREPSLTADQLRARLLDFAVDVGPPGPDEWYGAGILNARNSLTATREPPRATFARLYDAATGVLAKTAAARPDGSYAFDGVAPGEYQVFAGQDEDGDRQVGVPGRRWGAFGGAATPTLLTVADTVDHSASFDIGIPGEEEPNDVFDMADVLYPGGYIAGSLAGGDVDVTRLVVPQAGDYTLETTAWAGACGFALEDDTVLSLYDASGALIASNDDVDADAENYCSRITTNLTPGTYYLAVESYLATGGRYRVHARAGQ